MDFVLATIKAIEGSTARVVVELYEIIGKGVQWLSPHLMSVQLKNLDHIKSKLGE